MRTTADGLSTGICRRICSSRQWWAKQSALLLSGVKGQTAREKNPHRAYRFAAHKDFVSASGEFSGEENNPECVQVQGEHGERRCGTT